jgi:hypothetical protein
MTDLRKAAEDLLEGVEAAIKAGDWVVDGACDPDSAIIALRQALAPKELPRPDEPIWVVDEKGNKQLVAKKNRAQPVDAVNMSQERVDETAKREHEPYGYLWFTHQMERRFTHYRPKEEQRIGEVTPIYTAPPKREWVGLTEEEVHILWMDMGARPKINGYDFAKVIEYKLKERNCG